MPLYLAAFCIFLACKRGNLAYGSLCALATVGVMFALTGLSASWFMLLFMFAPYGLLAYFMQRFTYFRPKSGIIRGIVMAAYFNLTMFFLYLVATRVVITLDIPITQWVNRLGGYWVIAIIGTVVLVPLDVVLTAMSIVILKRLPAIRDGGRVEVESREEKPKEKSETSGNPLGLPDEKEEKKYDIFGYEIIEEENEEKK